MTTMVKKRTSKKKKVKWNREFSLIRYQDGNYVALTAYEAYSYPKPVGKEDAYLFTPSKAEAYLKHYGEQFPLEIVPVDVYLD